MPRSSMVSKDARVLNSSPRFMNRSKPVKTSRCVLPIGAFTEIQKGAVVGARTRVQSHTFICELVTIGEDCFVGHGVMFVNDTFSTGGPARGRKELWRKTVIGNRVSIGSNATIMPVRIVDDVVIGAGSVVTKDITAAGTYAGNPARLLELRGV